MSLIMYYRGHFAGDMGIADEDELTLMAHHRAPKTYLDPDHTFAGAACGSVLTPYHWRRLKEILAVYQYKYDHDKVRSEQKAAVTHAQEQIKELYHDAIGGTSSLYCVYGKLFLMIKYVKSDDEVTIAVMRPDIPHAGGSGCYAANVVMLADSLKSFRDIFTVVALAAPGVTPEHTTVDLSKVIGSHWYKPPRKKPPAVKKKVTRRRPDKTGKKSK